MYALIEFAGKQFRVEEGASIKIPYLDNKVGSKITIEKVLYMDDGKNKKVGTPFVKGVKIDAEIESHGKGKKVVAFKFKRRKGYQKKNTHRQDYSVIKVGKLGKSAKSRSSKAGTKVTEKKVVPKKIVSSKKVAKKTTSNKTTVKKTTTKKTSTAKTKATKE